MDDGLCLICGKPFLPAHGLDGDCRMFVSGSAKVLDWQPIGTAPRDGTPMLRPHVSWGAMAVRHKRPDQADEFTKGFSWMSSDYSTLWPDEAFGPFWMPLPSSPQAAQ